MRLRKQLTTTLETTFLDELKEKAKATRIPMGTLLEDAWLTFKGQPTPLTTARRQMLFGELEKPVKRAA